jgi:hypothetical protein
MVKIKRNILVALMLIVLLFLSICTVLTPLVVASQTPNATEKSQNMPTNNVTSDPLIKPPNFGNLSARWPSTNSQIQYPVSPTRYVNLKNPQLIPPAIKLANGTSVLDYNNHSDKTSSMDEETEQLHVYQVDFWADDVNSMPTSPHSLSASFTAVPNTINGLTEPIGEREDGIYYLPLNVAYGYAGNFVWFQFGVFFQNDIEHGNVVNFALWYAHSTTGIANFINVTDQIPMTYTPGHTYTCSFDAELIGAVNTVTFSLSDNGDTPWTYHNWIYSIPSIWMVYDDQSFFSPSSIIEVYSWTRDLTNIPYIQSFMGGGESTYHQGNYPSYTPLPHELRSTMYKDVNGPYIWAMLSQYPYFVSSIYDTYTWGSGTVTNQEDLEGSYSDNNYANIYGQNVGDGGYIIGEMDGIAGGTLWIRAYGGSGYQGNILHVYVSLTGQQNDWVCIGGFWLDSPEWIYVGPHINPFKYIAVAGLYTSWPSWPLALHIDAVSASAGGPDPPVSVYSYDDSIGEYSDVPYYLNDNYYGNTPNTVELAPGAYTIGVPDYNGNFEYFIIDDEPVYDNPATITLTEGIAVVIVAYYNSIPTCDVTVQAVEYPDSPTSVDVNVDNYYVGTTGTSGFSVNLAAGEHTIDFPFYEGSWSGWYFTTDVTINSYIMYTDGNDNVRWGLDFTVDPSSSYTIIATYITG